MNVTGKIKEITDKVINEYHQDENLKLSKKSVIPVTFSPDAGFKDSSPSQVRHQSVTIGKPKIEKDALITVTKNKQVESKTRLIQSKAAMVLRDCLNGYFAHDLGSLNWHKFTGTHWEPLETQKFFDRELIPLLIDGTGDLGFTIGYKSGVISILADGDMLPLPKTSRDFLPFTNGLLNLKTRQLHKITPGNAMTWCLPYQYDNKADCSNVETWLMNAVDGDKDTVQFLRAFMAAVLHGRNDLQKFLHLKGSGGTGKGTFIRLLTALVGDSNTISTDLQNLEHNRFETSNLYNKRLAVISESDKYGGSINVLKAVTGQDYIRLERKNQQQKAGGFIFQGLVVIASNESLRVTDHTSGLDRRRITVIFDRRVTDAEKQKWEQRGGEDILHAELPGLVNWLLELSQEQISAAIRIPPARVLNADREAMRVTNPIADWILECCEFDSSAFTQVGNKREIREPGRETRYENADSWLYANYLQWCQRANKKPVALNQFPEKISDTCETLGHKVERGRVPNKRGIQGLKLANSR